jgi:hypothetical protein
MSRLYKAYLFKTKDPAIDELRTLMETYHGRRVNSKDLKKVAEDGGPTKAAMDGWFFGKTRRPQSATLEAAGRAIGYRRKWVKSNGAG